MFSGRSEHPVFIYLNVLKTFHVRDDVVRTLLKTINVTGRTLAVNSLSELSENVAF